LRSLRGVWRLLCAIAHLLHGLAIVFAGLARWPVAAREARIGWWAAKMLRVLGVALHAEGAPVAGANLLVANHVSWLDILAIHAVCPRARFVSKADVGHWPVIGRLVAAAGTLFIERDRKRDALRVVHQMAAALQRGETVAVFPEGTTSEGDGLLPFHANLLQAAISAGCAVQPLALRFADAQHPVSPAAAYVGDVTLLRSVWAVVRADGLTARVRLLPPIPPGITDRRALAGQARACIAGGLDD
jgi:1-acyl-sn-glycerol-3-phosphate acyltransferase